MKTRQQIYGQEAAGILRDVSMYTVLQEHAADWHEFDLSAEEVPV